MAENKKIDLEAGVLRFAPKATARPADLSTAPAPAWKVVSFTESGSSFEFSKDVKKKEVHEKPYPVKFAVKKIDGKLSLEMSEVDEDAVTYSMGVELNRVVNTDGSVTLSPKKAGAVLELAVLWRAHNDSSELYVPSMSVTGSFTHSDSDDSGITMPMELELSDPGELDPYYWTGDSTRVSA